MSTYWPRCVLILAAVTPLSCCGDALVRRPPAGAIAGETEAVASDDASASSRLAALRTPEGQFVDGIEFDGKRLQKNGAGLCEWGFLGIDLYQAALYTERVVRDSEAALRADQVMLIHLDFVRGLTGAQLREAYTASTKVNTGDDLPKFESALEELCATMADVVDGDTYSFLAVPDRGLLVYRDGVLKKTIADEAFRKLFVRLYLGDKPPTKALRRALLGATRKPKKGA